MGDGFLSDADAFTVQMEHDPLLRSTIIAVAVLDTVPDRAVLEQRLELASRLAPTFRCRLEPGLPPIVPPRWVPDTAFDLNWHLRWIGAPSPYTLATVLEFARTHGMAAFDPVRPRWDMTVIEGLEGGRAALVIKVHHALTDGIGGIKLAEHVVDLQREPLQLPDLPSDPWAGVGGTAIWDTGLAAARHDLGRALGFAGALAGLAPRAVTRFRANPLRFFDGFGSLVGSIGRMVQPITDTLSPVMTERRLDWNYRALDLPFEGLRNAAHVASGTLNDAFLAGVGGGMARYHQNKEHLVEELRVTMPINMRDADDDALGGNRITLVRLAIPLGDHDPVSRMLGIDWSTRAWRSEPALPYSSAIAGVLNTLPTQVTGQMLKHIDLVASNVPGFDLDVFVAGAAVTGFYVFGPPIGAACNITLMSFGDRCCVGINSDGAAVPDADELVACLQAGFQEVLDLAEYPDSVRILAG